MARRKKKTAPSVNALAWQWAKENPEDALLELVIWAHGPEPDALPKTMKKARSLAARLRWRTKWTAKRDRGETQQIYGRLPLGESADALLDEAASAGVARGVSLLATLHADTLPPVKMNTHPRPILPSLTERRLVVVPGRTSDSEASAAVGLATRWQQPGTLPLYPENPATEIVLPFLELEDSDGDAATALMLRLAFGILLALPVEVRSREVRLNPTIRELLALTYPNSASSGHLRRDWRDGLHGALPALGKQRIPLDGGHWTPFWTKWTPGPDADLDARARLGVHLPPGAKSGVPVDLLPVLRLAVKSLPKFRALIAALSVAATGGTRFPSKAKTKDGSPLYLWTGERKQYAQLTHYDRRRFAFGAADAANRRRNRTIKEVDGAFRNLPGLTILDCEQHGLRRWRIVPDTAADAILKKEAARPTRHR